MPRRKGNSGITAAEGEGDQARLVVQNSKDGYVQLHIIIKELYVLKIKAFFRVLKKYNKETSCVHSCVRACV